ncbi:flap endonuclease-1 [Candidatus Micrarchaeota archaeon]|nr:flap endonuclease-1 [Candidatus Micrarchaeota archaeon]
MGVDIKNILVKKERSLDELKGRYAVDAFNALYQFLTIIRQPDGTPLLNRKREITSHLSGLFYRTCSLMEKNIVPIYVFDGEPSELKRRTIAERAAVKEEAEQLMRKAKEEGRIEEAARLAQRTAKLTRPMVEQSKTLLEAMGLPWVQAPSEGEAQCAWMAQQKIVNAAATQDFDALLFGAPKLLRNLTFSGKRKLPRTNAYAIIYPEEYDLGENLKALGLTRKQLVWIGILVGTDFNPGARGIGPKKALKLVKENSTFEQINSKLKEPIDFTPLEELFMNPPYEKVDSLQRKRPDAAELKRLMVEENDFSEERVSSALERAFGKEDERQSSLDKWF